MCISFVYGCLFLILFWKDCGGRKIYFEDPIIIKYFLLKIKYLKYFFYFIIFFFEIYPVNSVMLQPPDVTFTTQ